MKDDILYVRETADQSYETLNFGMHRIIAEVRYDKHREYPSQPGEEVEFSMQLIADPGSGLERAAALMLSVWKRDWVKAREVLARMQGTRGMVDELCGRIKEVAEDKRDRCVVVMTHRFFDACREMSDRPGVDGVKVLSVRYGGTSTFMGVPVLLDDSAVLPVFAKREA